MSSKALDRLDIALRHELEKEISVEKATYAVRQGMVQQQLKDMGPLRTRDGLGQMIASIDENTYYRWIQQEGPQVFHDKKFMRKFLQDNPECRAPKPVTKAMVLV